MNRLYKADVINYLKQTWEGVNDVALVTLDWAQWYNLERLHSTNEYVSPLNAEKYLLLFISSVRLCCLTQANLSPINSGWFIVSNHSTENTMLKESLPSFVLQWTTIVCLVVLLPLHIGVGSLLTLLIPSLIPMLQFLMGL